MMQAASAPKEFSSSEALCQICNEKSSKYMCPRCGVPYCSLPCYKNESKHLQCSESFYRDCVTESLKEEEASNPENAKKMKEVLQRFQEQYKDENFDGNGAEELDSDDDEPLETRLSGINLDDAEEVWKHLSEDEKKEFQSLVRNMDAAVDFIPEWVPWWNEDQEKQLVTDVTDVKDLHNTAQLTKLHKRQPDILTPIPKMKDLTVPHLLSVMASHTSLMFPVRCVGLNSCIVHFFILQKVKPNQHVAKGLVNVIAAYVWTSKLFNGDIFDSEKILEVASSIIFLSSFLSKDGVFKTIEHAIADVPMNACQVPNLSDGGTSINNSLNRDIWIIVKGPESCKSPVLARTYVLSALTECYTVFVKASKALKGLSAESASKSEQKSNTGESFSKLFPSPHPILSADLKLINKAKRKTLYLLAFGNEFMDTGLETFGVRL
ncbi:unnamed protein product [Orchesella dallaii]|uniref:HIT-type domain-containing protein n=1 Tax=Orchesella dallaii TaxID=48710 RepID=A0ABP1QZS1_9HEXA